MDEEAYKKELQDAGVEIPVAETPKEEETPKEPEVEKTEEPEKPLETEPREQRKRSIYDDLKEKKQDLRAEKDAREQAERERDELRSQLESFQKENNLPEEESNDLLEYAAQKGADPELVKRIVDEARSNQPQIDPELRSRLDKFENWQKQNAVVIEKQMFEEEFNKTIPSLKELFPSANPDELNTMKVELDKLSHSQEMHDKPLDYVAFKHREQLNAFISPRKVGIESKGRNQVEETPTEFNPNADLSKMSAKQLEAWEATYRAAINEQSGVTGNGKKKMLL
jgi:hypothetical protein